MPGNLIIRPLSGNFTRDTDWIATMDIYCIIEAGSQKFKTPVIDNGGKTPNFSKKNLEYTFRISDDIMLIQFQAWNENNVKEDKQIGMGALSISNIKSQQEGQMQVSLSYKGKSTGTLNVHVKYYEDGGQQQSNQKQKQYPDLKQQNGMQYQSQNTYQSNNNPQQIGMNMMSNPQQQQMGMNMMNNQQHQQMNMARNSQMGMMGNQQQMGMGMMGNQQQMGMGMMGNQMGMMNNPQQMGMMNNPQQMGMMNNQMGMMGNQQQMGMMNNQMGMMNNNQMGMMNNQMGMMGNPQQMGMMGNPQQMGMIGNPQQMGMIGNPQQMGMIGNPQQMGIMNNQMGMGRLQNFIRYNGIIPQYNPVGYQAPTQPAFGQHSINRRMIRKTLPRIFRQFDQDYNGLDYNEYFHCIANVCQSLGLMMPNQVLLASYFYEFDKDRSGKLEYKEFKRLMNKMLGLGYIDSSSENDSYEEAIRRLV